MSKEWKREFPEYVIWDFNGTILDDVETGILAVNHLLRERGLKPLNNREEYQAVFGFPIKKYYERLGFDFNKEPYEVVAPLWVEQYMLRVPDAPLFNDVRETLARFRSLGIRQILLSATESEMLRNQLDFLEITEYFEEILGLDNIHASSKVALAEDWRRRHPHASALMLGDTDHDLQAAHAMGAACVLIARGHQSAERLSSLGVPVLRSLSELF